MYCEGYSDLLANLWFLYMFLCVLVELQFLHPLLSHGGDVPFFMEAVAAVVLRRLVGFFALVVISVVSVILILSFMTVAGFVSFYVAFV